jgi:hypothetical protein
MSQNTRVDRVKSLKDLSQAARELLLSFRGPSLTVPRLTGAPFEIISRGLATFVPSNRGYVLDLTEAGFTTLLLGAGQKPEGENKTEEVAIAPLSPQRRGIRARTTPASWHR